MKLYLSILVGVLYILQIKSKSIPQTHVNENNVNKRVPRDLSFFGSQFNPFMQQMPFYPQQQQQQQLQLQPQQPAASYYYDNTLYQSYNPMYHQMAFMPQQPQYIPPLLPVPQQVVPQPYPVDPYQQSTYHEQDYYGQQPQEYYEHPQEHYEQSQAHYPEETQVPFKLDYNSMMSVNTNDHSNEWNSEENELKAISITKPNYVQSVDDDSSLNLRPVELIPLESLEHVEEGHENEFTMEVVQPNQQQAVWTHQVQAPLKEQTQLAQPTWGVQVQETPLTNAVIVQKVPQKQQSLTSQVQTLEKPQQSSWAVQTPNNVQQKPIEQQSWNQQMSVQQVPQQQSWTNQLQSKENSNENSQVVQVQQQQQKPSSWVVQMQPAKQQSWSNNHQSSWSNIVSAVDTEPFVGEEGDEDYEEEYEVELLDDDHHTSDDSFKFPVKVNTITGPLIKLPSNLVLKPVQMQQSSQQQVLSNQPINVVALQPLVQQSILPANNNLRPMTQEPVPNQQQQRPLPVNSVIQESVQQQRPSMQPVIQQQQSRPQQGVVPPVVQQSTQQQQQRPASLNNNAQEIGQQQRPQLPVNIVAQQTSQQQQQPINNVVQQQVTIMPAKVNFGQPQELRPVASANQLSNSESQNNNQRPIIQQQRPQPSIQSQSVAPTQSPTVQQQQQQRPQSLMQQPVVQQLRPQQVLQSMIPQTSQLQRPQPVNSVGSIVSQQAEIEDENDDEQIIEEELQEHEFEGNSMVGNNNIGWNTPIINELNSVQQQQPSMRPVVSAISNQINEQTTTIATRTRAPLMKIELNRPSLLQQLTSRPSNEANVQKAIELLNKFNEKLIMKQQMNNNMIHSMPSYGAIQESHSNIEEEQEEDDDAINGQQPEVNDNEFLVNIMNPGEDNDEESIGTQEQNQKNIPINNVVQVIAQNQQPMNNLGVRPMTQQNQRPPEQSSWSLNKRPAIQPLSAQPQVPAHQSYQHQQQFTSGNSQSSQLLPSQLLIQQQSNKESSLKCGPNGKVEFIKETINDSSTSSSSQIESETEEYCRCEDGSYSLNGCTPSGLPNPCMINLNLNEEEQKQFFEADSSLSPAYFIHCSWNIPFLKKCPADLVWSQVLLTCDWPTTPSPAL